MLAPVIVTDNCYLISSPLLNDDLIPESFNRLQVNQTNGQASKYPINTNGRAPVSRVTLGPERGILRHYYRGGLIANVSNDKFLWNGIRRARAVVEYRLLEWMTEKKLPVPVPLGARVQRYGLLYSCDIITREVPDIETLAERLQHSDADMSQWSAVGQAIRKLHDHNVFHTDLNANNILLDQKGTVTIIDFDKCRVRDGTAWKQTNIARLKRSLDKLTKLQSVKHFNAAGWTSLLDGYES